MAAATTSIVSSVAVPGLVPSAAPPVSGVKAGLFKGIAFPAGVDSAALFIFQVNGYSGTTGLKVDLVLVDDSDDPFGVVSKNAYMGAKINPIASTGTPDLNATTGLMVAGTEVLLAVTMPSTLGVLKTTTISVPSGSMNSIANTNWAALQIRRNGSSATDTDPGRVILLAFNVYDY